MQKSKFKDYEYGRNNSKKSIAARLMQNSRDITNI